MEAIPSIFYIPAPLPSTEEEKIVLYEIPAQKRLFACDNNAKADPSFFIVAKQGLLLLKFSSLPCRHQQK